MNLTYIGDDPAMVGIVPLREGWPAANHDESDEALRLEKLASGAYREWEPADGDDPEYVRLAVEAQALDDADSASNQASDGAEASESQQDAPGEASSEG